jgi:peptide/nickel transport system ATP-binding protein
MENEGINRQLLSVRDLVVEYTTGGKTVHAVNGVSFQLGKGRTLGLVGETGAGKTTIAKAIMRILPDPPAKVRDGSIFFEGQDILHARESDMRKIRGKRISMIFQDPMTALNPVKRVLDQVAEVIYEHNDVSKAEAIEQAVEMLRKVRIPEDRVREYPHQFSGGMKQRVVIAIALACNPDLLLADEPTTALDVTIQAQVLEIINRLKVENNTSMILITHDLGVVAENCDDVAVVYAGSIVECGSLENVFDHPTHPYTKGLFGSIPDLSKDVARLSAIIGLPPDPTDLPVGCSFAPRCPYATEACRASSVDMTELTPGHLCRCINWTREER